MGEPLQVVAEDLLDAGDGLLVVAGGPQGEHAVTDDDPGGGRADGRGRGELDASPVKGSLRPRCEISCLA